MFIEIMTERFDQLYEFLFVSAWGVKQVSATMFVANGVLGVVAGNLVKKYLVHDPGGTLDHIGFVLSNQNGAYVHKGGEKWVALYKTSLVLFFVLLLLMIVAWT